MLNSVHVTAAAAIVTLVPEPAIALPLALASHIILDTVPHWNWHPTGTPLRTGASILDVVLAAGLSLVYAQTTNQPWVVLAACFLSTLPDLVLGLHFMLKLKWHWLGSYVKWESRRQKWPWMSKSFGLATQAVTVVASLWVIYWR